MSARDFLKQFGKQVGEGSDITDDMLWSFIIRMGPRLLMPSEPSRDKLAHVNTIEDVVELLRTAKNIVVVTGAGISVPCGIPDFRSENGLYSVSFPPAPSIPILVFKYW